MNYDGGERISDRIEGAVERDGRPQPELASAPAAAGLGAAAGRRPARDARAIATTTTASYRRACDGLVELIGWCGGRWVETIK